MKKILSSFILMLSLLVGVAVTQPVFAAHTSGYDLVKETSTNRWYLYKNNSKNSIDFASSVVIDFEQEGLLNVIGYKFGYKDGSTSELIAEHTGNLVKSVEIIYSDYNNFYEFEILNNDGGSITGTMDDMLNQGIEFYFYDFVFAVAPDTHRPAISGQENFVTSVDDAKPLSFFQSYLSAIDETDGNLTSSIYVVTDNYTPNKLVLGTYKVTFGVKDLSNNESTLEINITVADVTKPVINGNTSVVNISYTQTFNIETFRSSLTVTDNYATITNSAVTVKTDNYTSNKTNLGNHTIVFAVKDPSNNEGLFTKTINVIDDIAPTFTGPTTLTKPATSILTLNEIKNQLTATDAKEGNKTSTIAVVEDNYTGNGNRVGTYTVKFSATDSKGNIGYHIVTVQVRDNIPPVWYIQDGVSIKMVPPATLNAQQIIDLLVATNQLTVNSTTQVNYLVNEYEGNETTPGVYVVSVAYSNTSGNEGIVNLSITVLEDESNNPIVVEPGKDAFNEIITFITSPFGLVLLVGGVGLVFVFLSKKNKKRR